MKTTKEQLQKEALAWQVKYENLEREDIETRTTLSGLLGSYRSDTNYYSYETTKKIVVVKDWLSIAFLIGELKADANYATCIEETNRLRTEIMELKQTIEELHSKESK